MVKMTKKPSYFYTSEQTQNYCEDMECTWLFAYKTQKARGYAALCTYDFSQFLNSLDLMRSVEAPSNLPIFPQRVPTKFPSFARPCPARPRHGFVESRTVHDRDGALRVVAETLRADREGEVIFASPLTAQWSFVASNGGLSIGKGNAGATGGGETINIPCLVSAETWVQQIDHRNIALACSDNPENASIYLEGVEHEGHSYIVQVRGGPEITVAEQSYIPRKVTVSQVLRPEYEDLLTWEKIVKHLAPGTVVWMPGASLFSHYAIHCMLNQVPFLTTVTPPKVGDVLAPRPVEFAKPSATELDIFAEELRRVLYGQFASTKFFDKGRSATLFAVGVAHANNFWPWSREFSRLRAEALLLMIKLTAVVCIGEARHFRTAGPGRPVLSDEARGELTDLGEELDDDDEDWVLPENKRPARIDWPNTFKLEGDLRERRTSVYELADNMALPKLLWLLRKARQDLAPPGWTSGMGGRSWESAAVCGIIVFRALKRFLRTPEAKTWSLLMQAWNSLAWAAHNGGALLNKWADENAINRVSHAPTLGLLNGTNIQRILRIWKDVKESK